jgi:hypothetical protein
MAHLRENHRPPRSWDPAPSMRTLSTGYQRPQPRIITRSCPFHLLTATIRPSGQLTCTVPKKACSTRAALIWRMFVDCTDARYAHSPVTPSCAWGCGVT